MTLVIFDMAYPEWVLKHKRKKTEITCIGGRYYLYARKSYWCKKSKKYKDSTDLIGRITQEDGLIPKKPRIKAKSEYNSEEIILIAFFAILCGAKGWVDIANYGKAKEDYLGRYYKFKNGIPSKDTISRFFEELTVDKFKEYFTHWFENELLRKINDMVTIKAIVPYNVRSLYLLNLRGTQQQISNDVALNKDHYLVNIINKNSNIAGDLKEYFGKNTELNSYESKIHKCTISSDIEFINEKYPEWEHLKYIIQVMDIKINRKDYYLCSTDIKPKEILGFIYDNNDTQRLVTKALATPEPEKAIRTTRGNAPEITNLMGQITDMLLKRVQQKGQYISELQNLCGWNDQILEAVICGAYQQ